MHLVHKNIVPQSYVRDVCTGSFTKQKEQEMISISGSIMFLYSLNNGKMILLQKYELMATLLTVKPIKLPGTNIDLVSVTSDSGYFHVFQLLGQTLVKVHAEPFGRSGTRRIVPGIYSAVDPKGRAVMIAALELKKLTFILNREDSNHLISSPLEVNSPRSIVFSMCGVDVGFDNPVFAVLECCYDDATRNIDWYNFLPKQVIFYELDLGLNTMVKKHTAMVNSRSHILVQVPSPISGVIVFTENQLEWVHPKQASISADFPFPANSSGDILVIAITLFKSKKQFFYILQFNNGHVFKLEFDAFKFTFYYLVTLPKSSHISVFRSGYIYFSNLNFLFQIDHFNSPVNDIFEPNLNSNALIKVQSLPYLSPLVSIADYNTEHLCFIGGQSPAIAFVQNAISTNLSNTIELPSNPVHLFHFMHGNKPALAISTAKYTIFIHLDNLAQFEIPTIPSISSILICNINSTIMQVTKDAINTSNDKSIQIPVRFATFNNSHLLVYSNNKLILYDYQLVLLHSIPFTNVLSIALAPHPFQIIIIGLNNNEVQLIKFDGQVTEIIMMAYPISSISCTSLNNIIILNIGTTTGHLFTTKIDAAGGVYGGHLKYINGSNIKCTHDTIMNNAESVFTADLNEINVDLLNVSECCVLNNQLITINDSECKIYELIKNPPYAILPLKAPPKIVLEHKNDFILIGSNGCTIFNPTLKSIVEYPLFANNEVPLAATLFNKQYFIISTAMDVTKVGFSFKESWLKLYLIDKMTLVHATKLTDLCFAIHPFMDFIMVGMDTKLRLYDLGKKQMLLKKEIIVADKILKVHHQGNRVYLGLQHQGLSILEYSEGEFILFCDDYKQRFLVATMLLDYDTIITSDKYGCIEVLRIPLRLKNDLQEDRFANKVSYERGYLNGAPHRLEKVNSFYCGDIVTHFKRLNSKIRLSGINGTISELVPILLKSRVQLFEKLEIELNKIKMPLNRMHLAYRSSYGVCKQVVDYDFIDGYLDLEFDVQKQIAEKLESTVTDMISLLYEIKGYK